MIRILIGCMVMSVLLQAHASSQEDKVLFHEAVGVRSTKLSCERVQNIPSKSLEYDIDVLSYDVYVDLYNGLIPIDASEQTQESYKATVDIRLVVLSDTLTGIPLHSDVFAIDIDSVRINNIAIISKRLRGKLYLVPPFAFRQGDTLSLHIAYTVNRVPGFGLVVVNGSELAEALGSYPIAFTFSEPENSRRWFPCNDVPHDKAHFRARARMPVGNRLVSNGELERTSMDGDSAKIDVWSCADVMPTYLFVMNVSNFSQIYQLYTRADGTGVPIRNFQWDTDESGLYDAHFAVRNVPEMFEAFEPRFGRYPFSTYGHCAVHPINIGGMEHQTMTTVTRKWLEGNAETGYAHELGHQWLGNAVTCATWGDIWLNEGGATFSEAVWREHDEGIAGYTDQMMRRRRKYMDQGFSAPAVWDIPIGNLFNEATTYAKASWVYHMMRRMLGDELFFSKLQLYLKTFRGQSIQTAQFESFWKQQVPNPPVAWDTFFEQWLVKRGHPVFWVRLEQLKDTANRIRVVVDQVQEAPSTPNVFHCLVGVRLYSQGIVVGQHQFVMNERSASFTVDGSLVVDSIEFDPDMLTLNENITDVAVSVSDDEQALNPSRCETCPTIRVIGANPVAPEEEIVLGISRSGYGLVGINDEASFSLVDMRGLTMWSAAVSASQNTIRIFDSHLSAGAYVAVLTSRWGTTTTRIIVR